MPRINADTADPVGSILACACGQPAGDAGRRRKRFRRVLGPLRLARAHYHCAACNTGGCPRDEGWV